MSQDDRTRMLEAEVAHLRAEVARRDAALATLSERVVPVEQARAAGAAEAHRRWRETELSRLLEAERELTRLRATKFYRYLLGPREALFALRSGARKGSSDRR